MLIDSPVRKPWMIKGGRMMYPARYCPYCSDVISRFCKSGTWRKLFKYAEIKTCGSRKCIALSRVDNHKSGKRKKWKTKGEKKPFNDRHCRYCGDVIDRRTKSGSLMRASQYLTIKTCRDHDCKGRHIKEVRDTTRTVVVAVNAIDRFLCRMAKP